MHFECKLVHIKKDVGWIWDALKFSTFEVSHTHDTGQGKLKARIHEPNKGRWGERGTSRQGPDAEIVPSGTGQTAARAGWRAAETHMPSTRNRQHEPDQTNALEAALPDVGAELGHKPPQKKPRFQPLSLKPQATSYKLQACKVLSALLRCCAPLRPRTSSASFDVLTKVWTCVKFKGRHGTYPMVRCTWGRRGPIGMPLLQYAPPTTTTSWLQKHGK